MLPASAQDLIANCLRRAWHQVAAQDDRRSFACRACPVNDLRGQVAQFKAKHGQPITIGIVGINRANQYVSYEGEKEWPTTGIGRHKHPYQEADETESRLLSLAAPHFDEFLILQFKATNSPPFPFSWVDPHKTNLDYGAVLARVSGRF
jgi:hypothetical protein